MAARRAGVALATVAVVLVALLLLELGLRIGFPCDLFIWSESPFMTSMLKLWNGAPIYTDPFDVNSFIYSPGLEYVTYAALAPFGAALDVRFCRLVNVLIGLGAAAALAAVAVRVAGDLGRVARRPFLAAAFSTATLLVFGNFTAAVPHPDNLQMLHAMLTLLLCWAAVRSGSFPLGVLAMAFSGLGVLAKQTAAFTWVGAGVGLVLAVKWRPRRAAALVAVGALAFACAALPLVLGRYARLFTLALPAAQPINWSKTMGLFEDLFRGHRLVLLVLAPACAHHLWRTGGEPGRRFVVLWATLFTTAGLPNLAGYMKQEGSDNNLYILGLWWLALVLPIFPGLVGEVGSEEPSRVASPFLVARIAGMALVLAALVPLRLPPSDGMRAYCQQLVDAVGADVRAGKRVLLAHGTTPLIRSGALGVPLDRGNTVLEYVVAGRGDLTAAMRQRIARQHYDRIYANGWMTRQLPLIKAHYHEVARIPAARLRQMWSPFPYRWGEEIVFKMMGEVVVYEASLTPRASGGAAPGSPAGTGASAARSSR